ncbi:nucleotidyl transferase AbiEii/AbiGii toxin family protein [Pararhizobium sp. A13]|uniref:nucleotidyl transferase AbiEii/AbiGii toxin family protein n=1 Tax=Pararhizobium sp. A13 TaxID=3133975 RepID=UPI00311B0C51
MKAPKNIGVSVRDRLTQRARERRENAQLLMTRYAIERVLYRLSVSPYRDRFVLKGAMLFSLWAPVPYRATGDLDLLGFGENAPAAIAAIFVEILATQVEDDGVIFRPETLRAAPAREEDEYAGVRLDFVAELAGARLPMHVDIGYGDVITPEPVDIEYPALLGQPAPHLRAYPPETVVAEKFQAMVALDMLNSRMKDFFDLWAIAGAFAFEGEVLARAIQTTFASRETRLPTETPLALTAGFADAKQVQWAAFLRRTEIALAPEPLPEIQARIAELVMPPTIATTEATTFNAQWVAGGPWVDA